MDPRWGVAVNKGINSERLPHFSHLVVLPDSACELGQASAMSLLIAGQLDEAETEIPLVREEGERHREDPCGRAEPNY